MGNEAYKKIIDKQSEIYDKERKKHYFRQTSTLFKKLIPPGKSVLDVGCGTGLYVIDLIKNGRHAVGLDYSGKMIQIAKKNAMEQEVNCEFIHTDAEKEINMDRKFDYALLVGNWEYFDNPTKLLKNVAKILKNDGKIIISTPNIMAWPVITFLEKTGIKKLAPAFWHFNSIPSRMKRYASNAGFTIQKSFFNYYLLDKVYVLKKAG